MVLKVESSPRPPVQMSRSVSFYSIFSLSLNHRLCYFTGVKAFLPSKAKPRHRHKAGTQNEEAYIVTEKYLQENPVPGRAMAVCFIPSFLQVERIVTAVCLPGNMALQCRQTIVLALIGYWNQGHTTTCVSHLYTQVASWSQDLVDWGRMVASNVRKPCPICHVLC